ncbi:MAG: hypothetical protein ACOYYS_05380 [Chloroflexota bacterium]
MCKDCGCQSGHACACGSTCECGCGNCGSSCGRNGHFERRFQTKAEQIAELEAYLGGLKLEVQAVEEHLADLRK